MAKKIEVTVAKLDKALGALANEYYAEASGRNGDLLAADAFNVIQELLEDRETVGRLAGYLQIALNEEA